MKIRPDIVQVYREVHSWVGILCSLFLFVAFYAGSISMFEQSLQVWLTPASSLPKPVELSDTPQLLQKVFAQYPDARTHYTIIVNPDNARPARLMWAQNPTYRGSGPQNYVLGALSPDGELHTLVSGPSGIPFFIDQLHEQIGLPLPHVAARYTMGCVAVSYFLALVSGVIIFFPSLKKMLFALRLGTATRKVWLDMHNLVGFFSLPFHFIMAATAVVFAFHGPIFALQGKLFQHGQLAARGLIQQHGHEKSRSENNTTQIVGQEGLMPPQAVLAELHKQAPGFIADTLEYTTQSGGGKSRTTLRIAGHDERYPTLGASNGFAVVDPANGRVLSADYLPGHQSAGFAALTAFIALHFGSYGGLPVRWGYYCLGLGGAFLFYTGSRLWIIARQKREQHAGKSSKQRRTTWLLSCLTTGGFTGCITGIAILFICAPFLPLGGTYNQAFFLYYTVFLLCMGLSFILRESQREPFLFRVAGYANIAIAPVMLVAMLGGRAVLPSLGVGMVALVLGCFLLRSVRRFTCGPSAADVSPIFSQKITGETKMG
ncbi:PepSY-associated TM helix domain-containing protein [Acetobacter fabarum]|uniref:PepSY-associated TM helix domain-containing protein n=1 Tax=Acetobacter fabarum TaxID=483199 RepID=UPI00312BBE5C